MHNAALYPTTFLPNEILPVKKKNPVPLVLFFFIYSNILNSLIKLHRGGSLSPDIRGDPSM
jgi:hypothetical protein